MSLTPSTMLELGTPAPTFSLPDTSGKIVNLADFSDAKALLVVFMCNHCPYVKHLRHALAAFGREYQEKHLAMVGINSNDADNYPDDAPGKMQAEVEENGYTFPYLFDASQDVAKAYRAACTPDFFLFDGLQKLVYRGQYDDSRPGKDAPITGYDLRAAADKVLAGDKPSMEQTPSIGCNIKWKPGAEPDYFR